MGMIAGYCSRGDAVDVEGFRRRLETFHVLPGDDPVSYSHLFWRSPGSCVMAKFKENAPLQIRHRDGADVSLVTLGFHDVDYSPSEQTVGPERGASAFEALAGQVERSEGEFVSFVLDHRTGQVRIINDRFAVRPVYVLETGDGVAFSSNLAFLLHMTGHRPAPDPLGWLEICTYGHTIGTRTNVQGVWKMRPASHLVVDKGRVSERRYWRLVHEPRPDLDPTEHAERTFEAICRSAAMRSRLVPGGFVSLSGGLDSRLVAGATPDDAGMHLFTMISSVEGTETPDVRVARQVARILGREHHIQQVPPSEVSTIGETLIRLTAGLLLIHHPAKSFQAVKEMKAGAGFKMGGGPGDSLAGAYILGSIHDINPRLTGIQVEKYLMFHRCHSRKTMRAVFRREVVAEYYPQLDEAMHEAFATLGGPAAAHRTTAWNMVFHQPAWTFTSPIHNHPDVTEASPHLGYDYVDRMLELPAAWLFRKNFYKYMIWHCLPALREVEYANTGERLSGVLQTFQPSLRKRVCGTLENLLPTRPLQHIRAAFRKSNAAPCFEYDLLRSDSRLMADIREVIHSVPEARTLLDVASCDRYLDDFQAGRLHTPSRRHEQALMGGLATLCYWLRYFASGT